MGECKNNSKKLETVFMYLLYKVSEELAQAGATTDPDWNRLGPISLHDQITFITVSTVVNMCD